MHLDTHDPVFPSESALHLKLLGGVSATWQGQPLPVSAPRMLGLLAYLHLHGPAPRHELEMVFWPGQGAKAVRQGLYTLRNLPGAAQWLHDGPEVSISAGSDVQQVRAYLDHAETELALQTLDAGPLLGTLTLSGAPEFEEWQESTRAHWHDIHKNLLLQQAREHAKQQRFEQARAHLHRLLALDPLDESTSRDLMQLEHDAGRPEQMLEAFEHLRQTLQRELHSEPENETLALLHHLEGHDISGQTRAWLLRAEQLPEFRQDTPLKDALCGREGEQETLRTRLHEQRRALVQGMAGMGKTRLAWAVAESSLQASRNVLWLELGGDPAEALLPALLEPLGFKHLPPRHQPQLLQDALNQHQVGLIVLDNAANSYALSLLLEYLPASTPTLVTSRLRLPRLPTLSLHRLTRPASLQLMAQHTQGLQPPPDPYALDALAAMLGDHPYALRLTAMTLATGQQRARELLQALSDAPHTLGDERSVKTLLAESLRALDTESYEAYLGLGSLLTPQATPELLALALRRDPEATERALYTLQQHGLTIREARQGSDQIIFRMHELTWHDAKTHAALQPKTVVQAACQYAAQHSSQPEHLHAELPNLIAAAQHAEQHAPSELIQIMTGWLGGQYIAARGYPVGYLGLLRASLKQAQARSDFGAASLLGGKLGDILQELLGDRTQAIQHYLQAARDAGAAGQPVNQAVRLALAAGLQALLNDQAAQETLAQARYYAEQSGDILCLCRVLNQQGIVQATQGQLDTAQATLLEARTSLEGLLASTHQHDSETQLRYISVLGNLSQVQLDAGQLEEALEVRQLALHLAEQRQDQVWIARSQMNLGEVWAALNRPAEARVSLQRAAQLFRELGAAHHEAATQQMLSALAAPH